MFISEYFELDGTNEAIDSGPYSVMFYSEIVQRHIYIRERKVQRRGQNIDPRNE